MVPMGYVVDLFRHIFEANKVCRSQWPSWPFPGCDS